VRHDPVGCPVDVGGPCTCGPDVLVRREGSIVQFCFVSDDAQEFLTERITCEPWQWMGDWLSVDLRLAGPLAEGIQEAGLALADERTE